MATKPLVLILSPFEGKNARQTGWHEDYATDSLMDSLSRGELPISARRVVSHLPEGERGEVLRRLVDVSSRVVMYGDRGYDRTTIDTIAYAQTLGFFIETRKLSAWSRGISPAVKAGFLKRKDDDDPVEPNQS